MYYIYPMSVDVLPPSAPEYSKTENLYPSLFTSTSPDAFRLQKISDVQNELEREADHYRQVAKNINKPTPLPTLQHLVWAL